MTTPRMRIQARHFLTRSSRESIQLLFVFLLALSGNVLAANEAYDAALSAERTRAQKGIQETAAVSERLKTQALPRMAALEDASSTIKTNLTDLQKPLLAALTRDDASEIQAIRARLSARQAQLDANETEKNLLQKELDESDRDREVWKRRVATMDLALRMDMNVMLAGPAEIEAREKRVEAAQKEMASQSGQEQKYHTRMATALLDLEATRAKMKALSKKLLSSETPALQRARQEEMTALRQLEAGQVALYCLNTMLAGHAQRNLAFARTDLLVSRQFADALAQKASLRRSDELQNQADTCEAQMAAMRKDFTVLQRAISSNLTVAGAQSDAALQALADARTAHAEEEAHGAYATAQMNKNLWDAQNDCWKEYLALQKAGAAFARECADRARSFSESHTVSEINREEKELRETLPTSEQYVQSFEQLLKKIDLSIAATQIDLGSEPLPEFSTPLTELFASFDAARPPSRELLTDLQQSLTARIASGNAAHSREGERRQILATTLASRLMQREMLRTRKTISERWIAHTHATIDALERQAGRLLWAQHDPRLNTLACQELVGLCATVVNHTQVILDCSRAHIVGLLRVANGMNVLLWLMTSIVIGMASSELSRFIRPKSRLRWLAARALIFMPPLLCVSVFALYRNAGDRVVEGLGWYPLLIAIWLIFRFSVFACTKDHQRPDPATLAGGFFTAANNILLWTVLLLPLLYLAHGVENPWDVLAVIQRIWLFGVGLAAIRLGLHPMLLGRLLSRDSTHAGLRRLGSLVALACMIAVAMATLPYLAGLNNLGRTVLHTVEASFVFLVVAVAGIAALGWLRSKSSNPASKKTPWIRGVQALIALFTAVSVALLWWRLLNRVVLAPNAPDLLRQAVHTVADGLQWASKIWHGELTNGMTVSSMVRGLLVFALSFWVSREAKRVFQKRVMHRTSMDETTRETFAAILGYLIILLGLLIGLNIAGSSLQNLALLAGAMTVGVGFGLQNVINNFVSSLLIHFGRSIRVGDYIDVGGTRGTVREIGFRSTTLVTDDEITVLVPNGSFITANIVNWTNPTRRIRLHVPVVVTRQSDLTAVAELVTTVAGLHPLIIKKPAPTIEVRTVTATQVALELLVWTEKPEKLVSIVGDLNLSLDRALRERGFAV